MRSNLKKLMALGMTACLLLGATAMSGCARKAQASGNPNKDVKSVIANLKAKTEESKYNLQGRMGIYDGKKVKYSSFHSEMKTLVADLSKAKFEYVGDWDPTKVTFPVYNLELEAMDFSMAEDATKEDREKGYIHWNAFWSNGYLITDSRDAWKCDFDFEKASSGLGDFFETEYFPSSTPAYNRLTALWNDKWYKENMVTLDQYLAERFEAPQKISKADGWKLKFQSRNDNGEITVTLTNVSYEGEGDTALTYGEYFGPIFVKIDGTWYQVPWDVSLGEISYHDIGYMLYKGDSADITCPFGYLPKGEYAAIDYVSKDTGVFEYDLAEFTI